MQILCSRFVTVFHFIILLNVLYRFQLLFIFYYHHLYFILVGSTHRDHSRSQMNYNMILHIDS